MGRLNLLCPITCTLGLLCTIWMLSSAIQTLIVFSIFFGFFSGMFVALLPPIVSQISPDAKLGARIGAFYSVIAVSSFIGTPIGGVLIKHADAKKQIPGDFLGVIGYAGGTLVLGALVMFGSRLLHDRSLRAKW